MKFYITTSRIWKAYIANFGPKSKLFSQATNSSPGTSNGPGNNKSLLDKPVNDDSSNLLQCCGLHNFCARHCVFSHNSRRIKDFTIFDVLTWGAISAAGIHILRIADNLLDDVDKGKGFTNGFPLNFIKRLSSLEQFKTIHYIKEPVKEGITLQKEKFSEGNKLPDREKEVCQESLSSDGPEFPEILNKSKEHLLDSLTCMTSSFFYDWENKLGVKALEQKKYREAYKHLRRAAEAGYPPAQFNLGLFYMDRTNKLDKAIYWYEQASLNDHCDAAFNLALILMSKNDERWLKWMTVAAKGKNPMLQAQLYLGKYWFEKEQLSTAMEYFVLAGNTEWILKCKAELQKQSVEYKRQLNSSYAIPKEASLLKFTLLEPLAEKGMVLAIPSTFNFQLSPDKFSSLGNLSFISQLTQFMPNKNYNSASRDDCHDNSSNTGIKRNSSCSVLLSKVNYTNLQALRV